MASCDPRSCNHPVAGSSRGLLVGQYGDSIASILHTIWPGVSTNQGTHGAQGASAPGLSQWMLDHVLCSLPWPGSGCPVQHAELPAGHDWQMPVTSPCLFCARIMMRACIFWRAAIHTQIIATDGEVMSQADFIVAMATTAGSIRRFGWARRTALLPAGCLASWDRERSTTKAQTQEPGLKQPPINPDAWALADWAVFVTNVPSTLLTLEEVAVLSRVRWQIELLFKRWKSYAALERSRSQNHWRILCEVYAKLLVVLIQHWFLLATCWSVPDRSLAKATIALRKFVVPLALLLHKPRAFQQLLTRIGGCIAKNCRLNKRHKKPSIAQLLMQFA